MLGSLEPQTHGSLYLLADQLVEVHVVYEEVLDGLHGDVVVGAVTGRAGPCDQSAAAATVAGRLALVVANELDGPGEPMAGASDAHRAVLVVSLDLVVLNLPLVTEREDVGAHLEDGLAQKE